MNGPPPGASAARGLSGLFAEQRETHLLGLIRIGFGAMLFLHGQRLADQLGASGYFGDRFFLPLVPPAWVPSAQVYAAMLIAIRVLGAAIVFGVRAREALLLASSMGLYLLACDRLQYHNNRFALLLLAFLLAFAPCDRSFALRRTGPPIAPIWAQRLFQLQVSLVYASSAISKVFDPDWFGGQVMWVRAARSIEHLAERGTELPAWAVALMSSPLALSAFSKLAIANELFLAVGLWHPRTRVLALWMGVLFHLSIELGANVELFSYVMWTSYIAFVIPELRERRWLVADDAALARRAAGLLRALDWLARWTIELVPRERLGGAAYAAIDRDGTRKTGLGAWTLIARTTPALFPLWLPAAALAKGTELTNSRFAKVNS
ncbi:MAG TPA: HTTM domain-containing protein [Polyangiales bacterium]|nr:HTTM domain-containing protein [Polyangiales bacterium]